MHLPFSRTWFRSEPPWLALADAALLATALITLPTIIGVAIDRGEPLTVPVGALVIGVPLAATFAILRLGKLAGAYGAFFVSLGLVGVIIAWYALAWVTHPAVYAIGWVCFAAYLAAIAWAFIDFASQLRTTS